MVAVTPNPPPLLTRRVFWFRRVAPLLPLLGVVVLAVWTPSDDGITICPFARATGHACPGCGMTRALSALLHGRAGQAWTYHPLVGVFLLELLMAWGWWIGVRTGRVRPPSIRFVNWALALTAVMFLVVWAVRAATGTLPPV